MGEKVCERGKCTGCQACADICPKGAVAVKEHIDSVEAWIDSDKCIHCNLCRKVCPNYVSVEQKIPLAWYQGWSNSENERKNSSSGGFAAEIARAFIRNGGAVCSCTFDEGRFIFKTVDALDALNQFKGSKYVKSNPRGAYKEIMKRLRSGQDVLFIGLPCQSAAVQNYVGDKYRDKLVTVDLICHGTPSAKLLENYMEECNYKLSEVKEIAFRDKNYFNISADGKMLIHPRIQDRYTLAFLKSLLYTQNCYSCHYATDLRVSDITIGDSWGSNLAVEEIDRGISLALCQTEKGKALLTRANVCLKEVDVQQARENNRQLCHPAKMPAGRFVCIKFIQAGLPFGLAVAMVYPVICIKQTVKKILLKMHLLD